MTRHAARRFADSLLVLSMLLLAACGGGGVSGPAVTTGALAITPVSATVYSDVPAQFVVTGGTPPYFITSSNGTVLPVPAGAFNYNNLTVIPTSVGSDTSVTLSATDAKNSTTVTAALTVKPRTISNVITVTPTVSCSGGVCPGGDATVTAVLTQAGVPLANRTVDFRIVSGDLRIIAPGVQPETLVQEVQVTTDATGAAVIRVRALSAAAPQTALLNITDVASGFHQEASVVIGAATGSTSTAPLSATPSPVTFQGTAAGTCASGITADVIVSGGKPPYQISQPAGFSVTPLVLNASGGRFSITANGQCTSGANIAVVDAAGSSVTVTVVNKLSDASTPTPVAFSVAPSTVSLSSCNDVANVVLIGGSGSYIASSGNGAVLVSVSSTSSGGVGSIQRAPGAAPGVTSVSVAFSDGKTTQPVTVTLAGAALGNCPSSPTTTPPLAISPSTITLSTCSDIASISVSGGSGAYAESASTTSLKIGGSASFFTVTRASSSGNITSPQSVTVSDGSTTAQLTVNLTGAATGTCSTKPPPSALSVSPTSVTLSDCSSSPNVVISGGTGTYSAAASDIGIVAVISNNILTISRASSSGALTSPQSVTVSDGSSSTNVIVNLTGTATGTCPTKPPASALAVSPSSVTLADCTSSPNVLISGGTGRYTAATSDTAIRGVINNNVLTITRASSTATVAPSQTVTVSDGTSTTQVAVTLQSGATGTCSTNPPSSALAVNPTSVVISDCTASPNVVVSGGTGSYSAATSDTGLQAIFTNNILTIRRRSPSPAIVSASPCPGTMTPNQCVTVTDTSSSTTVGVDVTPSGAIACP